MTMQGFPTIPIFEDEDGHYHLCKDFLDRNLSRDIAHNEMLKDLARRLAYDDKVRVQYSTASGIFEYNYYQ
jgi:hypothetical protein